MPCDRCNDPTVTYQSHRVILRDDGTREDEHLHLCAMCARAEKRAQEDVTSAIEADVSRRIADGSLMQQVRADLAPALTSDDPAQLAQAAEFLALIAAALPDGLPPDLREVVERHHRPASDDVPTIE